MYRGTECMTKLQLFLQTTRARTLPVMIAPVVIGAVLAWQQGFHFQWGLFVLTLIGALAAHLGANVINDVFDFGAGADQAAQDRSEEHTSELQSHSDLVCRLLLEKKND